uniref:Uncharacterized protein n=1 Tax=Plectus sambesii TaxID=2011161 RepID=A0A914W3S3_9BILA
MDGLRSRLLSVGVAAGAGDCCGVDMTRFSSLPTVVLRSAVGALKRGSISGGAGGGAEDVVVSIGRRLSASRAAAAALSTDGRPTAALSPALSAYRSRTNGAPGSVGSTTTRSAPSNGRVILRTRRPCSTRRRRRPCPTLY